MWPIEIFNMATGRHLAVGPTENDGIRFAVPENPTLELLTRSGSDVVLQRYGHSKWPPVAILDMIEPEIKPSICHSRKPHPRTKHEGDRMTRFSYGRLKSWKECEWALRSVGRQYSYSLH